MTGDLSSRRGSVASLRRRAADFVAAGALLLPGERALLMLSGGADSMALLDLISSIDRRLELGLDLSALHVDYATRGAASTRDKRIVEDACRTLAVPLHVVALAHKPTGSSFQERARQIRYEAARAVVARGEADVIVTAHNRDDQAETVLYRLTKYAASSSLRAMRPREAGLVRPLLCLGAAELRDYCRELEIAYGEDETNSTVDYRRNLVRHEVLPVLRTINPRVCEALAEAAAQADEEHAVLAAAVDGAWARVARPGARKTAEMTARAADCTTDQTAAGAADQTAAGAAAQTAAAAVAGGPSWTLDVRALEAEPAALRTLCLRRLARCALGDDALITRRLTQGLERLAATAAGSRSVTLGGGYEAVREYELLSVRRRAGTHACPPGALTPGSSQLFCGHRFRAEVVAGAVFEKTTAEAWLAVGRPDLEVVLRHPRSGDRLRPFGMTTDVLLSDLLTAGRVPRARRGRAVVAELDGEIAWVCPGRSSESFRVTDRTPYTLHIFEEATEAT